VDASALASALLGAAAFGSIAPAAASEGAVTVPPSIGSSAVASGLDASGIVSACTDVAASTPVGSSAVGAVTSALAESFVGAVATGSAAVELDSAVGSPGAADALAPSGPAAASVVIPMPGSTALMVVGAATVGATWLVDVLALGLADDELTLLGALTCAELLTTLLTGAGGLGGETGPTCAPATGPTISDVVRSAARAAVLNMRPFILRTSTWSPPSWRTVHPSIERRARRTPYPLTPAARCRCRLHTLRYTDGTS
jgi:hypothetical protein